MVFFGVDRAKTVMNTFDGFVPETVAELEKIDGM